MIAYIAASVFIVWVVGGVISVRRYRRISFFQAWDDEDAAAFLFVVFCLWPIPALVRFYPQASAPVQLIGRWVKR